MRLLKLGDKIYSQSIQHFSESYLKGFPQRDSFLLAEFSKKARIDIFSHMKIGDIATVIAEKKRLETHLAKERYDAILVDNPLSGAIIPDKAASQLIFDCIDYYDEMYLTEFGVDKSYHLLRYAMLDLLERSDKVVGQSPVILDYLSRWGLRTKKTLSIPNGYDPRLFFPYTKARIARLRKELGKKHGVNLDGKKAIVYTGKLGKWYRNIVMIAEAVEDDQVLFIVGDGPIIDEIPSKPNVLKVGRVDLKSVPDYTNMADVLVFPVENDCSPIAISEYLAVGKPIVMGKGRMEWLLKDGITGCMVDNNLPSWRKGIKQACKMDSRRNNLKLAADLSWEKLARKYLAFVKNG